jgi:RNA polymerase sigma-70 factor, ECF subfamily
MPRPAYISGNQPEPRRYSERLHLTDLSSRFTPFRANMKRVDEEKLISRACRGDRAAAEMLIRGHQASLYGYMLRMTGHPDVAEDVVQEAFVRVLSNLDRFDPRFRFSTWVFTIAKRLWVNACQKQKPAYNSEVVGACGQSARDESAFDDHTETRGRVRDALQSALLDLPEDQREIVVLFHQFDWPIRTIAQHMDMPEGTVKSHLHRGRRRMRILLEGHEKRMGAVREVWS